VNCREASIQISLHVGDDLPAAEVAPLEEHLEHCAVCQVEYESYASARDSLQLLKGESMASSNLWGELESQLDDAKPVLDGGRRWGRPVWTAIAAALVLAVSMRFWLPTDTGVEDVVNPGSAALGNINVGIGLPEVGPDSLVDDGPESETVPYEELFEILRGDSEQPVDLDDPMIAAPASRRSF